MTALATLERPVGTARLRGFVTAFADLLAATRDEGAILESGGALLSRLIASDDWLPEEFSRSSPDRYQQYLLHCDSRERFSVVSFVWGRASPRRSMITRSGDWWACCAGLKRSNVSVICPAAD